MLILPIWAFPRPAGATMPRRDGTIPPPVVQAFQDGLFALPPHTAGHRTGSTQSGGNRIESAQTRWYIPVIMVGFADYPLTHTAAEFETELFDTTGSTPSGSVYDYYQWASGGRLTVRGKVIATINLPNTRDFYAYSFYGLSKESTPQNEYGVVRDALLSLIGPVDWSQFDLDHDGWVDMLWVIHQGVGGENTADRTNLWSLTSRLTAGWRFGAPFVTGTLLPGSTTQHYQIDRFSMLPEISAIIPTRRAEIGVFCHEFGHALGLPDLYDTSGIPAGVTNYGPGNWSLMSTGGYGGMGLTPERPAGLGGWCQLFLGWATSVRPSQDTVITLRPIKREDPLIEFWFQGEPSSEHFLIENRHREGFDSTLPADGLIVTHLDDDAIAQRLAANRVNSGLTPGLQIVEADGRYDMMYGANRGDASDPFPGSLGRTSFGDETVPNSRAFSGAWTGISLGQIQQLGEDVQFRMQVRAPGWQPEVGVGASANSLFDSGRPARWARSDSQHRVFCVHSGLVDGIPQILLETRLAGGWQPAEVISHSPTSAFDPSIACLPGGDLVVVWTDTRESKTRIYARVRIRGAWQPEVAVAELNGAAHHAAVGADAHGVVEVAWLQDYAGARQLYFKRFAYLSPFGTPTPVTSASELPDAPALEVLPDGRSYLLWSDRVGTPRIYFARFSPDSGVSARAALTFTPAAPQLAVSAAVDPAGALHVAWQVASTGVNELHYQRRPRTTPPSPPDTVLESSGYLLQNPWIACDDSGGVHLAYEDWGSQYPVPSYRLWSPGHGWDYGGTSIPEDASAGLYPVVLPHSTHDLTVLYLKESANDLQLVQRTRQMGVSGTADVPTPPPLAFRGLELGPNPLRAGSRLTLWDSRTDGDHFEIFDLAGRRIAEAPLHRDGDRLRAEIDATTTARWPGGVYFARLSGHPETQRFVVLR